MEIYGFDHDDLASGGKAPYTFGMKNLMEDVHYMNSSNTTSGSFIGSSMYTYLQNTIFPNLPEDARNHIKAVNKKTSAGSGSSSVRTDSMKIFLFSVNEVAGTQSGKWVSNSEGSQYSVFSNKASRVQEKPSGSTPFMWWWLRSPSLNPTNRFCYVNNVGAVKNEDSGGIYGYPSSNAGVCFGFCV